MRNNEFWLSVATDQDRAKPRNRIGPVRVALLFGTMAVAMALLLPPVVGGGARMTAYQAGLDPMTTGTIRAGEGVSRQYTVRRSIAQEPGTVCILNVGDADRC